MQELRRLALDYSTRTLQEFLENVALVSDQDTIKEDVNAPTLLTLHAAKGLEFGAVFIAGMDDGILPHSRSFDEPEEMEEERRLFYVGITRAKDRLYLVRALRRGGRGFAEETLPSRFLDDIRDELIVGPLGLPDRLHGRRSAAPLHRESMEASLRGCAAGLPASSPVFMPGPASGIPCGARALCSTVASRMTMRSWMSFLNRWASRSSQPAWLTSLSI